MQNKDACKSLGSWVSLSISLLVLTVPLIWPYNSTAFPIYAQQNYESPREATGRIVCANCHLAKKPVDIEVPQAVLPDTVFEAVVKIPYDTQIKQVLSNGKNASFVPSIRLTAWHLALDMFQDIILTHF